MSVEPLYTKNLECSCVTATSATCPAGGEIDAFLTVDGNMNCSVEAVSTLTSPGQEIRIDFSSYEGSGPYFIVKGCLGDNCQYVEDNWQVSITGIRDGDIAFTETVNVVNVYDDGSLLIFSTVLPDPDSDLVTISSIQAFGVGNPTLPKAVWCKSVGLNILETEAEIDSLLSGLLKWLPLDLTFDGDLSEDMLVEYGVSQLLEMVGDFDALDADKIYGEFGDFYCLEKLYPKRDLDLEKGFGQFIGRDDTGIKDASGIYRYIDEGVYEGILKDAGDSLRLSDDEKSYIIPDSIHTDGLFQYKCELTNLNVRPEESAFRMRVSAPLRNYESNIAPLYTVYNIRLSDPSGNLIIKYQDMQFRGDADLDHLNYSTLSSLPVSNEVSEKYDWERRNVPIMNATSGYQLSFSVRAVALDDAFNPGFDEGFEENYVIPETFYASGNNYLALDGQPLSTQEVRFINPTNGFKISAVEICNSGGFGPRVEDYLPFYAEVDKKGRRLERKLFPTSVLVYDTQNNIYPSVKSVWEKTNRSFITNEDECGAKQIARVLNSRSTEDSITLVSAEGGKVADSGKLIVTFGGCLSEVDEIQKGAFNFQFDQGTKNIWWSPSGAFNVENRIENIQKDSIFFNYESITLRVYAKKQAGTRDYILDVVGYSDDKLLHNTPASGGFIQDPSGLYLNDYVVPQQGHFPVISGRYSNADDWVLSAASLSEKENFFVSSGNDHYKLTQYPVVTGTEFEWYEVPLTIVDDRFRLGLERNWHSSSLLENVHLDIFPFPSGASVAAMELCVRYAPQNALNMYTQGSEQFEKIQDGRSEGKLFPTSMGSTDDILNAGSGYNPISRITGLPHAYSSPDTIKTNYARRWVGVKGVVRGPYDPDMFDFGFENPTMDFPFLSGYFRFDNVTQKYVQSTFLGDQLGQSSGLLIGDPKIYQNVGWRFASGTLFERQLPGFSGNYTSADWTALSKGATTFVGNPMYGKIADAFDRVVRISGEAGGQKIDFGNIDTVSGFSIFTRFIPDANVSGQNYNLFNSGVIYAKWDTASELDFALGYKDGFLCGYAKNDEDNSVVEVVDTIPFSGYSFPVSVLLTYNDNQSSGLKLYVDNESYFGSYEDNDFDVAFSTPYILRAQSNPFYKNPTNASLVLGFAAGSGVGMNMLVSDFGVSTWSSGVDTLYGSGTNIVESNADLTYKQITAQDLFDNINVTFFNPDVKYQNDRFKLWDRVNEDTQVDWSLGAFKYCEFDYQFSNLGSTVGKRSNYDHIIFRLKHHGSGYSQSNDLPLLSTVDSGVAYHTQMENDFLRFHLSDVPSNFYAVNRRITKSVPCGYKFSENAVVVESVIEHTVGTEDIKWSGCQETLYGPKMIVSLYTKKQEPYWTTDEPNWGLVNRKIHYIEPSSCIFRADSTFTYDDICDETEEWAIFPREPRLKDFSERYFSDDVNDMFVQYDLVYPSGPAFDSRIQLHSCHVRMEDANIKSTVESRILPMYTSGNFPATASVSLNIGGFPRPSSGVVPLNINVPLPYDVFQMNPSGFVLNMSGGDYIFEQMPLFTPDQTGTEIPGSNPESPEYNPQKFTLTLNIDGQIPEATSGKMILAFPNVRGFFDSSFDSNPGTTPGSPNVGVGGGGGGGGGGGSSVGTGGDIGSGIRLRPLGMNLTLVNSEVSITPSGPMLNLNMVGSPIAPKGAGGGGGGAAGNYGGLSAFPPLFLENKIRRGTSSGSENVDVNLTLLGGAGRSSTRRLGGSVPLFINAPNIVDHRVPLYIHSPVPTGVGNASMPMYSVSYPVGSKGIGAAYGIWSNINYGTGVELEDDKFLSISTANEIRGVNLVGYGACTGNSPNKAYDEALKTDCTVWRERTCNEGGIFRAIDTYTNSGAINFSEKSPYNHYEFDESFDDRDVGYSGHYYGARKFTQLLPSISYNTTITVRTGSTDPIDVPRTYEEWEYGMCGPAWDADGCCTADCDQNIVFSGFKFVADDSNLSIDPDLLVESGRQPSGNYGETVKIVGDLMAVSAPNLDIPEYDPLRGVKRATAGGSVSLPNPGPISVSGAGAVFLYRRGTDVAGKKATWTYEDQLMLPTGFRKDYIQYATSSLLNFGDFSISGNKWQIGQEGRKFGESLALCSSGDREVVVVGAPRAKWEREFIDIPTSGILANAFLVTDLFSYDKKKLKSVAGAAARFNILWKYFTPPWNPGPDQWFPQVENKVIVLQLSYANENYPQVPTDESSWFTHRYIPRLDDLDLIQDIGEDIIGAGSGIADYIKYAQPVIFNQMYSGALDAFFAMYPSGQDLVYSGIPPIMGMFREKTGSTEGGLQYKNAFSNKTYNLYDEVQSFYQDHSYASGVRDFVQGIAQSGHVNNIEGRSEDVYSTARTLIADTFDSGRLSRSFTNSTLNRNFIASGVGQVWGKFHGQTANQFQIPPASGGRVYIFEKERDEFNCVQVIVSPDDEADLEFDPNYDNDDYLGSYYGKTYNDRFGHSVAISKNGDIVSVGSPWKPVPARVYERNQSEVDRVYNNVRAWCEEKSKTGALTRYEKVLSVSGVIQAQISAYDYLNPSERFEFRNDVTFWGGGRLPQYYTISYTYGYGDIKYVGTRQWIPGTFAPSSRLGWSTAVNDDGDIVAFGAPTDSFNEFEDANVWGDGDNLWASYQHAGAVRIFKSRDYYSHNKVVEFGLFGNLDRSTHDSERRAGFYDVWDTVFGSDEDPEYQPKDFRRMDFSEIEIPRDAGLCFITTPEIDAASDEIIENIKNWLALGDRNLVLVGNDPTWEENGLYKESNDIINKILGKLGSRMRIFEAKNEKYASQGTVSGICISQEDINNNLFNVTKSFTPFGATPTNISQDNIYGKGFGDIRIDLSVDGLEGYEEYFNCPEGICCDEDCGDSGPPIVNDKCEFPLKHHGDLRAQWTEQCIRTTPRGCITVSYAKNWPFQFNNYEPPCDEPPVPMFRKANFEPVPILTTMEHLPPSSWYQPATSGKFCNYRTIYEYRIKERSSTTYRFADNNIDSVAFDIAENEDSNREGNFNAFSFTGDFFDPDIKNNRDSLLQAVGRSYYPEDEERQETRVIYPESILGIVESGRQDDGKLTTSKIYLFGSQWSEDEASRGITSATFNDDKNTEFYLNMLNLDCNNIFAPKGRQINGFTGRNSLNDAYYLSGGNAQGHKLADKINFEFSKAGGYFYENQNVSDIRPEDDFIWIANPAGKPSAQDINSIKLWMNNGNKKVIITFNAADNGTAQQIAENVDYLCSGLNLTSRPFYLPKLGEYFRTDSIITGWNRDGRGNDQPQKVNRRTDSINGCADGYAFLEPNYQFDTSLDGVDFNPDGRDNIDDPVGNEDFDKRKFIPISGGQDYQKILWFNNNITEQYTVYPNNRYKIDGNASIEFPTEAGSGYRMFINYISEDSSDKFKFCGDISNATNDAEPKSSEESCFFFGGGDPDQEYDCGQSITINQTDPREVQQLVLDFQACADSITLDFDTGLWSNFIPNNLIIEGVLPKTPRLLSISGCPLEILSTTTVTRSSGKFPIGRELLGCEWIVNPAQSGVVPGESRPVKHKSGPAGYCPPDGWDKIDCIEANFGSQLIEDGPVVVAEEKESFSAFQAGRRRSRIIVVADSTMIQGQCPSYRASALEANQKFIRSLYPASPEEYTGYDEDSDFGVSDERIDGANTRNWFFAQKIRSAERGSPAKYNAVSGASIGNLIFDKLYGAGGTVGSLNNYNDNEDIVRNPTETTGRPEEIYDADKRKQRLKTFGNSALSVYGLYPRFSGDFLDILSDPSDPECYNALLGEPEPPGGYKKCFEYILDAGIGGGMHDLMRINNTDYLDLDVYYSGCLGDLFGYSIDMDKNQLIVGSPFNGFYTEGAISGVSGIVQWHEIVNDPSRSGMRVAEDGGAGAAFIYRQTNSGSNLISEFLPFEWITKIKPSSLNVGIYDFSPSPEAALTRSRGPHMIGDPSLIIKQAKKSDNFGRSVAIECDMAIIGAPHHDFETLHHHIYSGVVDPNGLNSAFQRKSFNAAFDIPKHSYYDLGSSGVRVDKFGNNSGVMILNAGAAFNYRNELINFQTRQQRWQYADKLYVQKGYKGREQGEWGPDPASLDPSPPIIHITSGCEFDNFGKSVSLTRAFRGDGDYTMVGGAPNHSHPVSGDHFSKEIENAGAAYNFDCMLRRQTPSIPNSGGWIDFKVFSNRNTNLFGRVYQNETGDSQKYEFSGILPTNYNGDMYLEVSGFDPSEKGFVAHRPYIEQIEFKLATPKNEAGSVNLFVDGEPLGVSGKVPLIVVGPDRANVYNNMDLYTYGVIGTVPSSMILYTSAPSGPITESLNLNVTSTQVTENLNLRMRGF